MIKQKYTFVASAKGQDDQLQSDWQGLRVRFDSLEWRAIPLQQKEILAAIRKQQKVLKTQQPTSKLYRTILAKMEELERLVNKLSTDARSNNK